MFADIVLPKGNESEFLEIAAKLGIKKLYFAYDFNEFFSKNMQKRLDSIKNNSVSFEAVFIISPVNINKASKQSKGLIAKSSDKDRIMVENKKLRIIYSFEQQARKDYLHQRASGLNHILCVLAEKNNVAIGFSYGDLIGSSKEQSPIIKGRMMQNIRLCQKYKNKTIIASFSENPFRLRPFHDLASMFRLMGMNDYKIKESFSYRL